MFDTEFSSPNEEVPLAGMLAEFRDALRAEIEAGRRNAVNTAVQLNAGRLIGHVGGSFQYAFKVESLLEIPDDSPADLIVPERGRIEATLVSVEGLNVILSVAVNVGAFIASARLQTDLTLLLRKLIERIENKRDTPNPAMDRLLGSVPVSGAPSPIRDTYSLNVEQAEAAASSIGRDTTFIWGPPGTGKTHTIGAIGAELYRRGQSCLIVSHTNIAVDQALLRIARLVAGKYKSGSILRVGDPRDDELLKPENKDLLLATHVELRQAELIAQKRALELECETLSAESQRKYRQIEVAIWAREGGGDIETIGREVERLREIETRFEAVSMRIRALAEHQAEWIVRGHQARVILKKIEESKIMRHRQNELSHELEGLKEETGRERASLERATKLLDSARRVEALQGQLKRLPAKSALEAKVRQASGSLEQASARLREVVAQLTGAKQILERARAVGAIRRALSGLPNPEKQAKEVERLEQHKQQAKDAMAVAKHVLDTTRLQLTQVDDLLNQTAAFGPVPSVVTANASVVEGQRRIGALQQRTDKTRSTLDELNLQKAEIQSQIDSFYGNYGASPEQVAKDCVEKEAELASLEQKRDGLNVDRLDGWAGVDATLRNHIAELARWELCEAEFGTADGMLALLKAAYRRACEESAGVDLELLQQEKQKLDQRIVQIESEVEIINQALSQVERDLISEATVIATTLTRAYLRDSIQDRTFDSVILDEASMAPIPALWASAALCSRSVIAVGDFKQLPPIVQASNHDLAFKWLGRDIFAAGGVSQALESGSEPDNCVTLKRQRRMHPQVSAISNHLIYRRVLLDDPWVTSPDRERELREWYRDDWGHDAPVLLVDTGLTNAWVTTVARGGSVSRLNFLSATVCVDLAEQLLRTLRPKGRKVLIVSPYRPHARLVNLLLEQAGFRKKDSSEEDEIVAGTAHSFQGSEADVVIFDLVVDEPHWKANLFVPQASKEIARLLNVALTRAKRRLLIVGDFEWCLTRGKQAFLGRDLLPFLLEHYPRVDALKVVPEGLAGRAAEAHIGTLGGDVEPSEARLVVTQEYFYPLLFGDIRRTKRRLVIYSPFLTVSRVDAVRMHLRAAHERGVNLFVVTKPRHERKRAELQSCIEAERLLQGSGAKLIHKEGMHEKLVFVDDRVLWSGSLNPLSYCRTQEVMERRASSAVVADYAKTLRLEELLAPFMSTPERCPVCGSEMIASEGGDRDPFYWRCVEDGCYSRGIDDPSLQDGMIVFTCEKTPEFRWWGDDPMWICTCGRRHRQKVHRNHLRLPKMKALIGKTDLRRLEQFFNR